MQARNSSSHHFNKMSRQPREVIQPDDSIVDLGEPGYPVTSSQSTESFPEDDGNTSDDSFNVSSCTFRPCSVDLRFTNVGYSVKIKRKPTTILDDLSGAFQPGKLHGIMGPSGAGKSSLLNVLAGFNNKSKGEIVVNGDSLPANGCHDLMASISSYIMQHDFLLPELTSRETLTFAARVKCPREVDEATRDQLVADLLKRMGLGDVADRAIWKLSGGQRKRIAVAVELINYPPVLFLDEPTTGLDSTSCYRLAELLKAVASVGCNVIATIHQPNSRVFRMFDTLFVLANGGRLAYSGPPMSLTNTLSHIGVDIGEFENPADLLFEKDNIARLADRRHTKLGRLSSSGAVEDEDSPGNSSALTLPNFKTHGVQHQLLKATLSKQRSLAKLRVLRGSELMDYCKGQVAPPATRFFALFYRWLIHARRDKVYFLGRFIAYTVCTLVVGLTFLNVGDDATKLMINIPYLYLLSMLPHMGTSLVTIMHFPVMFNVLLRESINSWYSVSAFYLSRAIIDNLMIIITAIIFPNIMWLLASEIQWVGAAVPMMTSVMVLHSIATHHFSYIVAMGGDEQSQPYLPFSLCMMHTAFSGFMIPINSMPAWIKWIQYVYYGQFTYRASLRITYGPVLPDDNPHGGAVKLPCNSPFAAIHPLCAFKRGDEVLDHLLKVYPSDGSLEIDIGILAIFYMVFFVLGWILLALRLRSAKRALART